MHASSGDTAIVTHNFPDDILGSGKTNERCTFTTNARRDAVARPFEIKTQTCDENVTVPPLYTTYYVLLLKPCQLCRFSNKSSYINYSNHIMVIDAKINGSKLPAYIVLSHRQQRKDTFKRTVCRRGKQNAKFWLDSKVKILLNALRVTEVNRTQSFASLCFLCRMFSYLLFFVMAMWPKIACSL